MNKHSLLRKKIKPAKIFVDAAYIINMPQLKGHGFKSVGKVTLSLKNNFGSVSYTADAHGTLQHTMQIHSQTPGRY